MSNNKMSLQDFMEEFNLNRNAAWKYLDNFKCLVSSAKYGKKIVDEHKVYLQAIKRREQEREKNDNEYDFTDIYDEYSYVCGYSKMLVLVNKRTFPDPVRYYRDFGREKRIWRREDVEEFFSSYQGEPEDKEKDKLTLAGEKALIIFFLTGRPDRYGQNLVSSINPASMYYQ